MVNIIVPVIDNETKYFEMISKLAFNDGINVIVGITENFKEKFADIEADNISFHIFEKGSNKESIINALQPYIGEGGLLLLRKPIAISDINKMISKGEDIVVCKQERSKLKRFFFSLWQKILKLLLGVTLYNGNFANMYISENLTPVLASTNNLSFSTRVDRWKGVEKGEADVKCEKEKYPVDKKSLILNLMYIFACISVAVVVTTLVCVFAKVSILIGLLLFCLDAISLVIICLIGITLALNCQIGARNVKNIQEIDIIE